MAAGHGSKQVDLRAISAQNAHPALSMSKYSRSWEESDGRTRPELLASFNLAFPSTGLS